MGFTLRCAIAAVIADDLAEQIMAAARATFPPFVGVRRFTEPFRGVIAAYDPGKVHDLVVADYAAHGYASEDAAYEEAAEAIDNKLQRFSQQFPTTSFAYVDVDCFGGTCMYRGYIVCDGTSSHREDASASGHQRLFARLGVADPPWFFAPFTRGYMETGVTTDLSRLPIRYSVYARWDEPFRLASIRATLLPPPWQVTILTSTSCVVVRGEDFYASLHPVDDQVEMRGRSFAEASLTRTLAHELADDDVALELRDPDGRPV